MVFWLSFIFMAVSFVLSVYVEGFSSLTIVYAIVFFLIYFVLPLFKGKLKAFLLSKVSMVLFISTFSPLTNNFIWIVFLCLSIYASIEIEKKYFPYYLIYNLALVVIPIVYFRQWIDLFFVSLLVSITTFLLYQWNRQQVLNNQLVEQVDSLNREFKQLREESLTSEEIVRQEERTQIAREIHDSVGHKLTALSIQIEVARLQVEDEEFKETLSELKNLAQTSLSETRKAVKTLKSKDSSGIQAVIQLIRELETESHLRMSIHMHSGVLGILLSNEQSVVLFRSIQEAITNMMRHTGTYHGDIEFKMIADHDLRFIVSHRTNKKVVIKEGFGLGNMRERIENIGGRLAYNSQETKFEVIGQFPLRGKE